MNILRAVLRYTECLQDGKNVFRVLSENNVEMLDTKQRPYSIYSKITVLVHDRKELNEQTIKPFGGLLTQDNCGRI